MTAVVVRGDAAHLPLPDESVDLIVCSPPYFGLRSYADTVKCYECIQMEYNGRDPRQAWPDYDAHVEQVHRRHYDGQIGSEATPGEYLEALWACTAEWVRVLKPSGSLFVNMGDKYAAGHGGSSTMRNGGYGANLTKAVWDTSEVDGSGSGYGAGHQSATPRVVIPGTRPKSLLGLPWRYAIGCVDRLGLILRAEIVWAKPNGLPESVTDRVRRSHEQVFHMTKQPRYFSAVDEIREPHVYPKDIRGESWRRLANGTTDHHSRSDPNPLGKLPGSVWQIPSAPLVVPPHLGVDHFAAYPPELVRRIVLGWSPPGVCTSCGEGKRPVHDGSEKYLHRPSGARFLSNPASANRIKGETTSNIRTVHRITGYACACPVPDAPARPAVVVDPFGGTGTTVLVASVLGRVGVTVDRSADYCRLAAWRVREPGERARVLGVPKPPPVPDGQGSLFDDMEDDEAGMSARDLELARDYLARNPEKDAAS